jgi:hypothetical protein
VTRVATFLLLLSIALVLLWLAQRRMIYLPFGALPLPADVGLPRAEAVAFATEDGLRLAAWFVPAKTAAARATVVVFNGNAGNRAFRAPLAARLAEQSIASLLVDYRGYGGNPGSPSEEGLARDARAARRYIAGRADVDARRIVYFGESLGTGVAVRLATEQPPSALILRSPFTSLVDMGRHHYPFLPVRWFLRDRFPSLERIGQIGCPVLVIAAEHDSIVPAAQSRRLYAAAPSPKRLLVVEDADHNDYELLAGPRVIEAIVEFLGGGQ